MDFKERSFDQIELYPTVIDEHIRWGDMDAFQHLNNTVYFKLFESARLAYFEKLNFLTRGLPQRVGPTLAKTECTFKKPLYYPCELLICARVSSIEHDRFTMQYGVFTKTDPSRAAAIGSGLIVCYDYEQSCKTALPEVVRHNMVAHELTTGT